MNWGDMKSKKLRSKLKKDEVEDFLNTSVISFKKYKSYRNSFHGDLYKTLSKRTDTKKKHHQSQKTLKQEKNIFLGLKNQCLQQQKTTDTQWIKGENPLFSNTVLQSFFEVEKKHIADPKLERKKMNTSLNKALPPNLRKGKKIGSIPNKIDLDQSNIYQKIMKELGIKPQLSKKISPFKSLNKIEKSKEKPNTLPFLDSFKRNYIFKHQNERKTFKQVVDSKKEKFYQKKGETNNKKFSILRRLKINTEKSS